MSATCELSLLTKLGSLAVHCEELLSKDGHEFDKAAIESILTDKEVRAFLKNMSEMALLPVKRRKKP